MCVFSSVNSKPSHWPKLGAARAHVNDDVVDSATAAARTSLAAPWPTWKCIPRTIPCREREWLSCHHLLGNPEIGEDRTAIRLHEEAPRSSPKTSGADQNRAVETSREAVSCNVLRSVERETSGCREASPAPCSQAKASRHGRRPEPSPQRVGGRGRGEAHHSEGGRRRGVGDRRSCGPRSSASSPASCMMAPVNSLPRARAGRPVRWRQPPWHHTRPRPGIGRGPGRR